MCLSQLKSDVTRLLHNRTTTHDTSKHSSHTDHDTSSINHSRHSSYMDPRCRKYHYGAEPVLSYPASWENIKDNRMSPSQCFHLQTPPSYTCSVKQRLQPSLSAPAFAPAVSRTNEDKIRLQRKLSNRPLPLTPCTYGSDTTRGRYSFGGSGDYNKSRDGQHRNWTKEPLRRKTFHDFSSRKQSVEHLSDHIYEEIDEGVYDLNESDKESEDISFLNLISSERRKNLKFYGCTDWDFGT